MGEGHRTKKTEVAAEAKVYRGSNERDADLERIQTYKRHAIVKAWEENEKAKANNKAWRKLSDIESWENSKKAAVEVKLRKIEENLEEQRAKYAEKMKNKIAELHKIAEEERARILAQKGEDLIKVAEKAAKFRSAGFTPRKICACF